MDNYSMYVLTSLEYKSCFAYDSRLATSTARPDLSAGLWKKKQATACLVWNCHHPAGTVVRKFSAQSRQYMLAYKAFGEHNNVEYDNGNNENTNTTDVISYTEIEQFIKLFKTH